MKRRVIAGVGMLALGTAFADESPLLGKPMPEIELSKALQGEPWSVKGLLGKVIVLDVFQLG